MRLRFLPLYLVAASALAGPEDATWAEGPWGRMELVPVEVRLSDAMVPDQPLPLQPWVFGTEREQTLAVLRGSGVEPALASELMLTYDQEEGLLRPPPAAIRKLSRGARGRLYAVLRNVPGNGAQHSPHKFARERFRTRFGGLRSETVALLEDFLYERETAPGSWLLADLPALTHLIADKDERVRLVQAASKQDSILLRLRIDRTTNAEALAEYWGRGGRRRDLEILITSLKDFESGYDLDAIYLLPPLARSFLFTYPLPQNAVKRDCFWTALNFFLPSPNDNLDGPALRRMMGERYRKVEGAFQLGDILVLWRPTGEAEHAAVYVAGDVYFTKNGGNLAVPWLLVRLEDLLERYDDAVKSPLTHFRRRDLD